MKSSLIFLVALVTILGSAPAIVDASTVLRSGDTVSIASDQLIEEDLYTAAEIINVSGIVAADLVAAGGKVTINGEVGSDALILAGVVDVHGPIGDDLRIVAGDVIIAEPVLGDVFVIGGTVKVLSSASITGDLVLIGGTVVLEGPVEGKVLGWVESLRVDAQVGQDIEITATSLTLGDKANVEGSVSYWSSEQLVRSQSAVVSGEIVRNDPVHTVSSEQVATSIVLPLLVILFAAALWYLLSRRMLQRVANRAVLPSIRPIIIGGLVLILAPFAIGVLLVSMLGSLVGFALLAAYVLFVVLSVAALPAVVGKFVYALLNKESQPVTLLTLLVGIIAIGVCSIVPIVGPLLLLGFFVLTFGAMADLLIRSNR